MAKMVPDKWFNYTDEDGDTVVFELDTTSGALIGVVTKGSYTATSVTLTKDAAAGLAYALLDWSCGGFSLPDPTEMGLT